MQPTAGTLAPSGPEPRIPERPHGCATQAPVGAGSRNLVVVDPLAPRSRPVRCPRPSAAFLAQLIAITQQAPQTRMRRQADPAEAASRYADATPTRTGQLLRSAI